MGSYRILGGRHVLSVIELPTGRLEAQLTIYLDPLVTQLATGLTTIAFPIYIYIFIHLIKVNNIENSLFLYVRVFRI